MNSWKICEIKKWQERLNLKIDDDKLVELYKQGYSKKEIAEALGYNVNTVRGRLVRLGYKKEYINDEKILELFNQGYSDKEIAEILGFCRSAITTHLNSMGYTNRKSKIDNIELRDRISKSLVGRYVGDKNPNYKGNRNIRYVARGVFKTTSRRLMRESNFTCSACGKRGGNLETHHIKPFNIILEDFINNVYDGNEDTLYEQIISYEPFMDESNMVVLCQDCHKKVHYTDNHELSPYRWESATTIERAQ